MPHSPKQSPRQQRAGLALALLTTLCCSACADARSRSVTATGELPDERQQIAASALALHLGAVATIAEASSSAAQQRALERALDLAPLLALVPPAADDGELPPAPAALPASARVLERCLRGTPAAATLTECELGAHVVDGTWSAQYRAAHLDLVDVFATASGRHGSLWFDARLWASERAAEWLPLMPTLLSIDGELDIGLMWSASGREHSLDLSLHIDGLALDATAPNGRAGDPAEPCIAAGVVTIDASTGAADRRRTTLWFGPSCGEIHMTQSAITQ
ncbi:hypothetical protein [Haliangium ochraceum]|uniref:Lipoprotein n=1 Tax=Haliangium ochraceum (strain DSM 14365 / JCM 11303 / SMP-2) TaxID=502025 RepID=D0LSF0_HALO1|nr:hypothetical protein [Haliangium ochraceum]ACY15649.1 hypothetical protein Hoch_3147 [Haliangium ochraceum DSM 14365]